MRFLFCGDVVGRSGREVVINQIPELRRRLGLDFVVVNGENAAAGFGITARLCQEFYQAGVDVITTGNHAWDQREIISQIDQDPRLLRPGNYPDGTPGRGACLYEAQPGKMVLVANAMGRLFMEALDCPFAWLDSVLANHRLGASVSAILIDFHAEATSEKNAFGCHFDGRVSLVAGSHTHVPTADARVLPGGTAYMTDVGMCGDYNSVIGIKKEAPILRFTRKMPTPRLEPADGEATLCCVMVETDDASGLAVSINPIRLCGCLQETNFPA